MGDDSSGSPNDVHVDNVLVPLDGSELALRAMPTARALAERFGAELHSVSVAREGDADRIRTESAAALRVEVDSERVFVATEGEPHDVIVRRASALHRCVVCLSTHGRGRLHGAVIGSVARSVLQHSTQPMIALGPAADNPGWSPRPRGWPEPLSVRRVVACVDGSGPSEQVLPLAAAWARALGMSMTILTVIEDTLPPLRPERPNRRYDNHPDAESYVDALVEQWRTNVPDLDGEVGRSPTGPASGVRAHLDRRPGGLVAVTTHARSGMQRVLLGATAANIVHASVAPCLVAPVEA
jgi:nucleotide-binding universal stress UspA family protein